jgi:hypothetical protein
VHSQHLFIGENEDLLAYSMIFSSQPSFYKIRLYVRRSLSKFLAGNINSQALGLEK